MKTSTRKKSDRKGQFRGRHLESKALAEIQGLLDAGATRRDHLIEYLHLIQDKYHCISAEHIVALAEVMKLSTTEIYEVASFYHHFDVVKAPGEAPPGLTVRVCDSVTCEMFGANALVDTLGQALGDQVRIQRVPCVGRCHATGRGRG